MGKRELVALFSLSSWCLVIVVWLFLAVAWVCLQFVIVVFPDHTHLLFLKYLKSVRQCIIVFFLKKSSVHILLTIWSIHVHVV